MSHNFFYVKDGEKDRDRDRESIYFRIAVKGKVVPIHTKKVYGGSIGIVILILKLASF